jgi:hypothetical protein
MDEYVSAEEAAALLGVAIDTVYVYVSRKGIRSIPTPNSSKRRYPIPCRCGRVNRSSARHDID